MHVGIAFALTLTLTAATLAADEQGKPESVQMFERLIQRIPADIDAHDVHKYIGKEFTYVFNAGNNDRVGVQWAPFWISERLYCIHCVQSEKPTVTIYQIEDPDLASGPFTEIAQKAYAQYKSLRKQRGAARVLDLYAVIDRGAELAPSQLKYTQIYSSQPAAPPNR